MNDTVVTEDQDQPGQSCEREARILDGNLGRRTSSGPADIYSAPAGRTYDRSRPNRSKRPKKSACHLGPSTYDDWGLEPLDAAARHDMLEILDDRYGRRSTVITSQLPVESWHQLIGDPTYADAILDRLVHNANRLELAGESLRRTRAQSSK